MTDTQMPSPDGQDEGPPGGFFERGRVFLAEVRNELKRVTWPSGREVYATTVVVIMLSVILGLYLRGLDWVFDRIEFWLFRSF